MNSWGHRYSQNANQKLQGFLSYQTNKNCSQKNWQHLLKKHQKKCYDPCLFGKTEILVIFGLHFERKDVLANSFWIKLTFRWARKPCFLFRSTLRQNSLARWVSRKSFNPLLVHFWRKNNSLIVGSENLDFLIRSTFGGRLILLLGQPDNLNFLFRFTLDQISSQCCCLGTEKYPIRKRNLHPYTFFEVIDYSRIMHK